MASFSDLLWLVKIDGQIKAIKRTELTSDSTTIILHTETETGTEEVYKCPSESPNYYHLSKLPSSDLYRPSDIVCGNRDSLSRKHAISSTLTINIG